MLTGNAGDRLRRCASATSGLASIISLQRQGAIQNGHIGDDAQGELAVLQKAELLRSL